MDRTGRVSNHLVFNLGPALRGWHRPHGNYKSPQEGLQPRAVAGPVSPKVVIIIRNVPLTEGSSVDDNNGVLDKSLGPDDIHENVMSSCSLTLIMISLDWTPGSDSERGEVYIV